MEIGIKLAERKLEDAADGMREEKGGDDMEAGERELQSARWCYTCACTCSCSRVRQSAGRRLVPPRAAPSASARARTPDSAPCPTHTSTQHAMCHLSAALSCFSQIPPPPFRSSSFFFNDAAPPEISPFPLHPPFPT